MSSLISVSDLPVEAEVEAPTTPPAPAAPPAPDALPTPDARSAPDAAAAPRSVPAPASPADPRLVSAQPASSIPAPVSSAAPPVVDVPRGTPIEIPIGDILPNPHQPRRDFDQTALSELAASLKSNGLVQPIVVRHIDGRYELVAGERRLRAAKLAGMAAIPAIVRELDSFTQAQMALVENIHRADLNPIERASAYRALIDQLGLTQSELAHRLGEDRSTVANFVRLLELAEPVRAMIRDGRVSLGHAKVLAGVADILEQERLANLVVSQGLSVRNLERLVSSPSTPVAPKGGKPAASAHLQDLEKSFARQLGMRVQIRSGANKSKGRVVIHYASLDQFDQLADRLGLKTDD